MENNLKDAEQETNSKIQKVVVNTADGNDKSPITVTTLYYTCDSNIFQSSESSVKVVSANNYNATVGHRRPNFCELDIITKKENLKLNVDFVPLQTITEELKSLPMSKKLKNSKAGFRKIYHKSIEGEKKPSEVLCLASVLKDDTSEYRPPLTNRSIEACPFISIRNSLNETSHVNQERKAEQENQKMKKKRSKSRRSKPESDTIQTNLQEAQSTNEKELDEFGQQSQSLDIFQIPLTTPQFVDLGMAKTMYYAELPNSPPCAGGNVEPKRVEHIQTPKPKIKRSDDKKKKKKHKKSKSQNKETKPEKQETNPKKIIINRVENEYPPPSSPGSLTTLPSQAYKKDSDVSFASLEPVKSLRTEVRRHNSPNSEESKEDVLRKYKTDTTVYRGNYRKKHRTSPKSSIEDNVEEKCKNDAKDVLQQPETELRVIYKIDQNKPDTDEKEKKKDKKKKDRSRNKKCLENRSRSTKFPKNKDGNGLHMRRSKSNMKDSRLNVEDVPPEVTKEKSKRHVADQETKTNEQESILDIYQKNEPLRSESCTLIAVEEYLKDADRKKSHKSRKSKSRSSSSNKKAIKKTDSDRHKGHAEDLPFLEDTKDGKTKERSKSRIIEEKCHKKRCKSKATKVPAEDCSQDLSKRISRRSTSDISKKNPESFDGHKSIEGVQKDRNASEKKHRRSLSSSKSTNKEEVTSTQEVKDNVTFPYKLPEQTVLPMSKEKRKRSKSYTPKKQKLEVPIERPAISSRSHIIDTSQHPSDAHFPKRQNKKVKASAIEQTDKVVNLKRQPSSKEKFYEELQKISNIQQVEESHKRFRVISRTVHSKLSDGSTTQSTEQSYLNKLSGSRRFKTYVCSEKEKEAILNLPIFHKDINQATTIKGENFEEYTLEIEEKRSTRNSKHGHKSGEMEERSKKKKKIRRTVSRKEVTFSHLNVAPMMDLYRKPSRNIFVRKASLPEKKPSECQKINKLIAFKDQLSRLEISEDTDFSSSKVDPLAKLSIFTMILGEKILEIYTKTIDEDGKIMEGFTVSGTEPPKRFKIYDPRKDKLKIMAMVSKLHYIYHPPIEIIDGVMKIETTPKIVKENPPIAPPPTTTAPPPPVVVLKDSSQVIKTVSAVVMTDNKEEYDINKVESKELKDELTQVTYRDNPPSKTPVFLKTKRKFSFTTKRKSSGKLNMKKDASTARLILALKNAQTSTESHSNSDSVIEYQSVNSPENSEVTLRQSNISQKQDNSSRISSAVKLMESSLQIIKEESQSTDSSHVSCRVHSAKEMKHSQSEIKETQTDLDVRDIDKIKEVITFLYRSIDVKNSAQESAATITANDKVFAKKSDVSVSKEDSSTESPSYQEQFKNLVRSVTPKFSGLRKNSKQEIRSKASVCNVSRPRSPVPSRIPMLSRRPSTSRVSSIKGLESTTTKISDTLSSSEPSSISTTPKDAKTNRPPKNQKNFARQRSNSADVLTSGYFEKYGTTKALIEQQRKKRAESADGTMRKLASPIEPEFKSSTSMSDFSSIAFSFKDDSTSIKSKEIDVAVRGSDEKYVQCVLVADIVKELIDKNIGTITEDEKEVGSKKPSPKQSKSLIAKVKSTLSFEKNDINSAVVKDAVPDKILSDKSLQTSVVKEQIKHKENYSDRKINVLYADVPCQSSTKRRILDEILNRMSSHSFVTPRKSRPKVDKENPQFNRERRRSDLNTFEKMNRFEKIRRVFAGKQDSLLKSSLFNCQFSEKRRKPYSREGPETDYINLMKLERHLERVLGLYPFIFKAIRSQIDDSTMRKLDRRLKIENPELFTSYDTLATTIDTVSDSFERYPSFSESNINRFNKYCESLNLPGQEYQLRQFIESQNTLRQCIKKQLDEKKKTIHKNRENKFSRNKEKSHKIKENTPVRAPTDTTSTSSNNNKEKFRPKFAKTAFKSKMKKKKSPFKKNGSGLSYISQNLDFCSSSGSNVDDWSIGSPLYSITTPSLNISFLGRSQSSTSIIKNKPTPVKLTKSNSVMEMSSIQKVNRRLALRQLVEANNIVKTQDNKQNVLVVSVNSSCAVFATPSKFLAKVEKQLQKSDDAKQQERNHNPADNSNTNSNTNNKLRQKTSKKQIDEQSFHSLFFSDSNMKSPPRSEPASHKPFFIHETNPRVTDDKSPDSLHVASPTSNTKNTVVAGDEEDLGNFSADSLESNEVKQQEFGRYRQEDGYPDNSRGEFEEYRADNLYEEKGPEGMLPQSFFVYSSTVNYNRNVSNSENKAENRQQSNTQNVQRIPPAHAVQTSVGGFINSVEDSSKTILSESGYESTKSKRTASIRNFFKKGGSLLDIFRNSSKNKIAKGDNRTATNFPNIWMEKTEKVIEINQLSGGNVEITEDNCNSRENSPCRSDNTVYWSTIKHISPRKERTTTFEEIASSSRSSPREKSQSPRRNRGTKMPVNNKSCSCSEPSSAYQRQMDECHAYAEKVLLESQMRREGYYKQYQDFKEIPLELLIGKRIPNKYKYSQEVSVMTKPKSKPIATQSRRHAKGKGVDATSPTACMQNIAVAANLKESRHDIVVLKTDSPMKLDVAVEKKSRHTSPAKPTKADVQQTSLPYMNDDPQPLRSDVIVLRGESRVRLSDARPPVQIHKPPLPVSSIPSKPSLKAEDRAFGKVKIRESSSFHDFWRLSKRDKDTSTDRKEKKVRKKDELPLITKFYKEVSKKSRSKSRERKVERGCTCDGSPKLPPEKPRQKLRSPPPEVKVPIIPSMDVKDIEEDFKPKDMSPSLMMPLPDLDEKSAESDEKEEMMIDIEPVPVEEKASPVLSSSTTSSLETRESASNDFYIRLLLNDIVDQAMYISERNVPVSTAHSPPLLDKREKREDKPDSEQDEPKEESEICRRSSEDFRKGLTDKEVFDKLLHSFEKEDEIATRLSKDEEFFKDQIKTIKKESDDSIDEEKTGEPNEIIYSEDFGGKHRSTHFWEEKMKTMRAEEENPVKEDDIGTCFSRGFRPDNIALSGDACFSLNKQDRIKFSKGMLTNEESIIDFSERETPLDFLLALGFMVDEASNALKDEDIRSRLLAAITEARVWINKITTTQGTLLYLVAYKSRPKTMRYFLQLVEAIINKRINNAIKLDGFLRVLEKVEEGEIQMINILGADKFEDEENEEKIVKKQLRQLFITVYKIAEKEAMMKGKQLSQQAVVLLRILAAKYRAGLHPHLELIARYIGQDLLNTETQLEAAMIFLSRLDTAEVKLKEFEAYCDIKCEKKKKKTALNNPETILERSTSLPEHVIAVTGNDTLMKDYPAPRQANEIDSGNQDKLERRDKQDKQQKQKKRDDSRDKEHGTKKKSNLAAKGKNKH